jgi:hypothetical protein
MPPAEPNTGQVTSEPTDLAANPRTRVGRERLAWTAAVVGVGLLIFAMMAVGAVGGLRPELRTLDVSQVAAPGIGPAERFGSEQLRIVGWYAELKGGCVGDSGGSDPKANWLQRQCPLRVLLSQPPAATASQRELELTGLRLAAPNGRPFPPRAEPTGLNLQLEQLVFVGHFADPAAASCVPERAAQCRNTFVVSTYTGLVK